MTTDFELESFWDLAYAGGDYLEHWESPYPPQELVAMVAAGIISAGATVLDIGCGAGAEAMFLARLGFQAIGVDSSTKAIEIARMRAVEAEIEVDFRLADATDLPLPDGSIDFAMDRGCFHVIDREQRRAYARELHRVLRPGAPFLLRGAAVSDDEEGVIAVDTVEIDRVFVRDITPRKRTDDTSLQESANDTSSQRGANEASPQRGANEAFSRGPIVPLVMVAESGVLACNLAVLRRGR